MAGMMRVGDTVYYRGGWGSDAPKPAVVEAIDLCDRPREKYGEDVQAAPWEMKEYVCVSLDDGHWAYGQDVYQTMKEAEIGR